MYLSFTTYILNYLYISSFGQLLSIVKSSGNVLDRRFLFFFGKYLLQSDVCYNNNSRVRYYITLHFTVLVNLIIRAKFIYIYLKIEVDLRKKKTYFLPF